MQISISKPRTYTTSITNNEFLRVRFPSKMARAVAIQERDAIRYDFDGAILSLEYLGQVKRIARDEKTARLRKNGIQLSSGRMPEIFTLNIPEKGTKLDFKIEGEKILIDLSMFEKKKTGFGVIQTPKEEVKKILGFAGLSKFIKSN